MVLGASFDTVDENAAFAEKFSFPFALLCDTERTLGISYGACADAGAGYADRISYLIGPDQTIVAAFPEVAVEKHPQQMLERL